jgi:two-component system, LytTR family, response regulator
MINCIIIDDIEEAAEIIVSHLEFKPEIKILKTFTNSILGMEFIIKNEVDLVFLDIDMPDLSGIELIETLSLKKELKLPKFILTTGHQEFALKGFEYGVFDYIVKPVTYKRFSTAIDRYIEFFKSQSRESTQNDTFFFAETEGKKVRINFDEILYIESAGNYVSIHKVDKRHVLLKSLAEIEQMLDPKIFMRIHKSFIVAFNHISSVTNSEVYIQHQKDNIAIPIGRTYKDEFRKRLNLD